MQNLVTKFVDAGICELNIAEVAKAWKDNFAIYRHENKYQFVIHGKGENVKMKVVISEAQAKELMQILDLIEIRDSFFRQCSRYIVQLKGEMV